MLTTKEIIDESSSLPIEARALIVDSLLKTLNSPDESLEQKWILTADKRLTELKNGSDNGISVDEVFSAIQKRFRK